ncbi:uncharacterized protein THITE_2130781 [Thermothielavioides terrestris NRRL 8126]|uniref:Rhodopsin domain-containing protein n=1 Tax=Thermothielavioides terrestris (strain ATCC 38088 / NRRL 8126) TaxID=578455 RepID=G2RBD9_THETT|nr:uncharacterized protein THITE_2130781 [Thermothielavioides terrestris NRRL 8126]AEO69110.1 hypothetical protein THITE_2130781 [Thermothielavioides terrestris NRRL 8126]
MDGSTLLALPIFPPASGLQIFALFVNFFFPGLALLVVSVRVAGRVAANQFAVDDWLVCIAMLMSIAETVISFFFIKTNFIGIPPDQVPPHDPTQGLIWTYAVQILYNPILALVKSSVLIFLTRLFGQKDGVRRFLLWLNVANVSQMVAIFFAILLQCLPIAFNWDPTIKGGRCVDRRSLYVVNSVFNIVTDFLILGLPLWIFSSLKLPKRTKIPLLIIFLLGFLATLTSIVRLILLVQGLYGIVIFPNNASNNVGFVTSAIETNLALITASAPALRPIFRSRDRGGWFARSVMPTNNHATMTSAARDNSNSNKYYYSNNNSSNNNGSDATDLEMGQKEQLGGWDSTSTSTIVSPKARDSTPVVGSKFGRGGSRIGRKGYTSRRKGGGAITTATAAAASHGDDKTANNDRRRGSSKIKPTITRIQTTDSAVVRVSDIQREIDGLVKDLAVAGKGSYTGAAAAAAAPAVAETQRGGTAGQSPTKTAATQTSSPPQLQPPPRTPPRAAAAAAPPRPRPSMETITVGATFVTPLPPRPSTSGSSSTSRGGGGGGAGRRGAPERYYSESIYPEQGMGRDDDDDDDYDYDDRASRYLDRRFGMVTPKGTTPTLRGWEGSGRPF